MADYNYDDHAMALPVMIIIQSISTMRRIILFKPIIDQLQLTKQGFSLYPLRITRIANNEQK